MTKNDILKKAKFTANRTGLKIKKHSPEIMLVAGIVGVVGSTVLACKATLKLGDVLDEAKENIDTLKEYKESIEKGQIDISEEEKPQKIKETEHAIPAVYMKTGLSIAKLYAPSVLLGVLSVGSIIGSHRVLNKRYVGAVAAYATIDKSFKEYRNRVVERFGNDLDKELRFNIKNEEVDATVVNEDGKEEVVNTVVETVDPNTICDFAKIWYEGNPGWTKDPQHNLMYLKSVQNQANDLLHSRGHLFLNEVYDMLGFPRIKEGQEIGWIYDEKNPIGDNFVDFGLYSDLDDEAKRNFINGFERSVLLDFNHDGNILQYI